MREGSEMKLLALASVAVLTLSMAAPGLAKPGARGPERNGHTCENSPSRSDMTDFNWIMSTNESRTHTFRPGEPSLCIDLTNAAPGTMTITVTNSKNAYGVGGNVKDSYPGDVCALFDMIDLRAATTGSTSVSIPAATIDACGTNWTDNEPNAASLVSSVAGQFKGKNAYIDVTISMQP